MIYIGVDPGKSGGYAIIAESETGRAVFAYPWDDVFFATEMSAIANRKAEGIFAAVEKVGAMPGQGVKSMFNFGKNAGYIEGVLSALGIPYQLILPATWKKEFSLIGKDKQASIVTCHKLFPDVDLKRSDRCRTDSDGKAEALLICEWGRRHL